MPPKTQSQEALAQDAARYGQRLGEIGHHLDVLPGETANRARTLLAEAAEAAMEASALMQNAKPERLRLHINTASQPSLIVEAIQYLLQSAPGDTPVMFHQGPSQQNLPFAIHLTSRLVSRLRALIGEEAVWTEARK